MSRDCANFFTCVVKHMDDIVKPHRSISIAAEYDPTSVVTDIPPAIVDQSQFGFFHVRISGA